MYGSVPEETKLDIMNCIDIPKKISTIAREINLSKRKTGAYLRLMTKQGDVRQIPDFKDLRSFYYVCKAN